MATVLETEYYVLIIYVFSLYIDFRERERDLPQGWCTVYTILSKLHTVISIPLNDRVTFHSSSLKQADCSNGIS